MAYYHVVRYVPNTSTGEFITVGVVLVDGDVRWKLPDSPMTFFKIPGRYRDHFVLALDGFEWSLKNGGWENYDSPPLMLSDRISCCGGILTLLWNHHVLGAPNRYLEINTGFLDRHNDYIVLYLVDERYFCYDNWERYAGGDGVVVDGGMLVADGTEEGYFSLLGLILRNENSP